MDQAVKEELDDALYAIRCIAEGDSEEEQFEDENPQDIIDQAIIRHGIRALQEQVPVWIADWISELEEEEREEEQQFLERIFEGFLT